MFRISLHGKSIKTLVDTHYTRIAERKYSISNEVITNRASLKTRIDNRLKALNKIGDTKSEQFFKDLKASNYLLLKRIIKGNPRELSKIIRELNHKITSSIYPNITYRKSIKDDKKFGDHIRYVFNYDSFTDKPLESKSQYEYDAYELANFLEVNVCSYCNRGYTFTLTKGKKKFVRPEFDHFFDKATYPYLALSFYNLIPSCHICNSNLKHDKHFTLRDYLHPYLEGLDDYLKFTVNFVDAKIRQSIIDKENKDYLDIFFGKLDKFNIELVARYGCQAHNERRANLTHNVFKTVDLFNMHKDLVVEMLQTAIAYNDSKVEELFREYEGKLFRNREDVLRYINKNYINKNELPNRTFSKLTRDIAEEFGIGY